MLFLCKIECKLSMLLENKKACFSFAEINAKFPEFHKFLGRFVVSSRARTFAGVYRRRLRARTRVGVLACTLA
jgi:hypothetical protein